MLVGFYLVVYSLTSCSEILLIEEEIKLILSLKLGELFFFNMLDYL